MYGDQRLLLSEKEYSYDATTNTIYINPDAIKTFIPGLQFTVRYTPISDYDLKYNKVERLVLKGS